MFRKTFLSLMALIALPAFAHAADSVDIAAYFCPAMGSEAAYDQKGLGSYALLVPGKDGWVFRSGSDFRSDFTIRDSTEKALKKMAKAFRKQDIDLLILYPPTRGMLHHDHLPPKQAAKFGFTDPENARESYRALLETLNGAGIPIVGLPDQPPGRPFFYERDHHWSWDGAKISAQAAAATVKALPVYPSLAKTAFKSRSLGPYAFKGTFVNVFKKLCGTAPPPMETEKYVTERAAGADSAAALFGDMPEPEIVLAGTSNSVAGGTQANFEGFLKEALQADVLNMSVTGGSIDSAILAYLNSNHYKNRKGKVLIWEVPGYYDFNHWEDRVFRQVTPAVYGDCGVRALAEAQNVSLKSGVNTLPGFTANIEGAGDSYYLSLHFSRPVEEKFTLHFDYDDTRDILDISRSARYPHDGEFYAALKADANGVLSGVSLDAPAALEGVRVNARLCRAP